MQGMDVAGMRYAIVCETHGELTGATSMPTARAAMKDPISFCTQCREVTAGGGAHAARDAKLAHLREALDLAHTHLPVFDADDVDHELRTHIMDALMGIQAADHRLKELEVGAEAHPQPNTDSR